MAFSLASAPPNVNRTLVNFLPGETSATSMEASARTLFVMPGAVYGSARRLGYHGFDHARITVPNVDTHRHRIEIEIAFVIQGPKSKLPLQTLLEIGSTLDWADQVQKTCSRGQRQNFIIGKINIIIPQPSGRVKCSKKLSLKLNYFSPSIL